MNNLFLRLFVITTVLFCATTDINAMVHEFSFNGINYELYYSVYNPGLNGSNTLPLYGASYAVVDSAVVGWNKNFNGFADIASSVTTTVTFSQLEYYWENDDPYNTGGAHSKFCTYTWEFTAPVVAIGSDGNNHGGGLSGPGLTGVNIPNTIKYIRASAFKGCTNLKSVTIPNSVTILGSSAAFQGCTSLTDVTIGNSVKVIGASAFEDCSSLTSINIPNSVETIDSHAFSKCTSLTSVSIGSSVTSIGNAAFLKCSSLTSIDIPNSVTSIGSYAFRECTNLRSVTLGNSIKKIGAYAFWMSNSINRVYINNLAAFCDIKFADEESNPLSIAHRLFLNNKDIIDLTIPSSVTDINDYAFYGFSAITSLSIPKTVTSIGNYAFYGCTGLMDAVIGDTISNVGEPMSIGNNAFNGCSSLKNLSIGNTVTNIGPRAFYNCAGLTNLRLPNSVKEIGNNAFYGCNNLTNINIPQSVISIDYDAFSYCDKLNRVDITDLDAWCRINFGNHLANPCAKAKKLYLNGEEIIDLVIPNTVTKIGDDAFYNCKGLKSATISNSVIDIGKYAFCSCSGMTDLTLGKSVAYLRINAFAGCNALNNIYSKSEIAPSMDNIDCFNNNTYNNATVYVPIGAKRDYELTNYWNKFANIVEMNMNDTPPGDANGDGEVNIADVNAVINAILGNGTSGAYDVNNDGEINIADINAIINFILNQ